MDDANSEVPRRVVFIGNSGSGKTTAARHLARALVCPHLELDSVYHQADWTPLPADEFRARVTAFVEASPRWVVDGNYSTVRDIVWGAADTVVWLDLPRTRNFVSILWRTARRFVRQEELWNGNRELVDNWTRIHDPEQSILAWAWAKHPVYRRNYADLMASSGYPGLRILRATSRSEVTRWTARWAEMHTRNGRKAASEGTSEGK